jgi:hypothetical protein
MSGLAPYLLMVWAIAAVLVLVERGFVFAAVLEVLDVLRERRERARARALQHAWKRGCS